MNQREIKLRNNQLEITLSSKGGGIIGATLFNYAHKNDANSDAVQFSYINQPLNLSRYH